MSIFMKKYNKKSYIRLFGTGILLLCTFSLVSVGFSAWYSGIDSPITTDSVNVAVGDVVLNSKGLKDFGFEVVAGSATSLAVTSRLNIEDDSIEKTILDSNYFSVSTTVDTQIMSQADYSDNAYLSISFAYEGYTSKTNNIIDSLVLYPENYVGYSFNTIKSEKTTQAKNGKTTAFCFPIKSKNDISLSSVASLDSTYPRTDTHTGTSYKVPIIFKFEINEETINSEIANSSFKYSVTFALSRGAID